MSFEALKLPDFILQVSRSLGLKAPTPVQQATIPQILAGRNVIAASPTGTGKTAAFAFPVISTLSEDPYGIYALVLSPTRELAEQIAQQFELFGAGLNINVCRVLGGLGFQVQTRKLEQNPHIVVATPGRMKSLLGNERINLSNLRYLILDEVDRLFNEGFWEDIEEIVSHLPKTRQNLFYTATMSDSIPLENILTTPPSYQKTEDNLEVPGDHHLSDDKSTYYWSPDEQCQPKIKHCVMAVPADVRELYLVVLIEKIMSESDFTQVLIFVNHCETAETLGLILRKFKFKTAIMHSKMEQPERLKGLKDYKNGSQRILVATDLAARGLDIPCVDHVIHFNPPTKVTTYIHRAGRTGRAGREGESIMFVNQNDQEIVKAIEEELGHPFEVVEIDPGETVSKMKEILYAKRDAKLTMFKGQYGEHEKKISQLKKARESFE